MSKVIKTLGGVWECFYGDAFSLFQLEEGKKEKRSVWVSIYKMGLLLLPKGEKEKMRSHFEMAFHK